jgi:YrbI family 3-deoxy-D-manno-octulosonate 8-phosphate phosphatase
MDLSGQSAIRTRAANLHFVKLLVLDFDGVMTDNRVLVDQDGREAVWCHRGDGWGIARLLEVGINISVLSTETNPVVTARCLKLGIPAVQGCANKLAALGQLAQDYQVSQQQVAYVGNDMNDMECMLWASVSIAVADATPAILAVAQMITTKPGGFGAVREVADWILEARGSRD